MILRWVYTAYCCLSLDFAFNSWYLTISIPKQETCFESLILKQKRKRTSAVFVSYQRKRHKYDIPESITRSGQWWPRKIQTTRFSSDLPLMMAIMASCMVSSRLPNLLIICSFVLIAEKTKHACWPCRRQFVGGLKWERWMSRLQTSDLDWSK